MILSIAVYVTFLFLIIGVDIFTRFIFQNKNQKIYAFVSAGLSCTLLWILFSFKGINTGSDTASYFSLYSYIANDSIFLTDTLKNPVHYEVGFLFFMSLIAHTGVPYIVFQMLTYSIICSSLFFATFKLSKNPTYSVFIFFTFTFYNFFISGLRQAFAISLCLLALTLFLSRKKGIFSYFIYFLIVACACSMHNSAILFLPIIFFTNVTMSQKSMLVLIFCMLMFYILGYQLYNLVLAAAAMSNLVYVEGYVAYSGGIGKIPILMFGFTILSFLILYPNVIRDKLLPKITHLITKKSLDEPVFANVDKNNHSSILIIMMFIGCCFEFLNRFSSGIGRGSMYFTIALIILLPNALSALPYKKGKYIVQAIFALGFIAFLFYYSIRTNIMNFQYEFYF